MKIIISPAKKMKYETDIIDNLSVPIFETRAEEISRNISSLKYEELKSLLSCNDVLAKLNFDRYQNIDFNSAQTPAILAYDGIQYKYMAPIVFENEYFKYVQNHLRILSGFYGVLKPLDRVVLYRLEMQAKLKINNCANLYEYWGDSIYRAELENQDIILDLASKEYSNAVKKYCIKSQRWVNVVFGEKINDKIIEKGVYVKMARGEMVRYMAENNIQDIEDIKNFNRLGYIFSQLDSNENKYVYIKENKND